MTAYRVLPACLLIAAILATGCASEDQPLADGSEGTEVDVVNIAFTPGTIEVDSGAEVVWTNEDEGVHHTVTSGVPGDDAVPGVARAKPPKLDGVFDGDLPDLDSRFTFTFDGPGTYAYFCRIHPSMTGEVVVK